MRREILCLDCGKTFTLSRQETVKIKRKGRKLPCHCPTCRNQRWMAERIKSRQLKKHKETENKNDKQRICKTGNEVH